MERLLLLMHQADTHVEALRVVDASKTLEEALYHMTRQGIHDFALRLKLLSQLREVYTLLEQRKPDELMVDVLTELIYLQNATGRQNRETLFLYDELAECFARTGDLGSAAQTYEEGLRATQDLPEDTGNERQYLLSKLMYLHEEQGDAQAAVRTLQRLMDEQSEQGQGTTPALMARLARHLQQTDPYRAESLFKESIEMSIRQWGAFSIAVAERIAELAQFYVEHNRLMLARTRFVEALSILHDLEPSLRAHTLVGSYASQLAETASQLGESLLVVECYEEASKAYLEGWRMAHEPLRSLMLSHYSETRLELAQQLALDARQPEALEISGALYNLLYDCGASTDLMARTLVHMGRVLERQGQSDEASRLFSDAQQLTQGRSRAANSKQTAVNLQQMAAMV